MPEADRKTLVEIAQQLGRYSIDAFEFLHEGLDFTVRKLHGPPSNLVENVFRWLRQNDVDLDDLESLLEDEQLPDTVTEAIEQVGGVDAFREKANRHIAGPDLCWGLRDLALEKWGAMAPAVLGAWGIRRTRDFGRLVFALVENDLLQKQPEDRLEDFDNVFDFERAFRGSFTIKLVGKDE